MRRVTALQCAFALALGGYTTVLPAYVHHLTLHARALTRYDVLLMLMYDACRHVRSALSASTVGFVKSARRHSSVSSQPTRVIARNHFTVFSINFVTCMH
jgi:hypothetical protein